MYNVDKFLQTQIKVLKPVKNHNRADYLSSKDFDVSPFPNGYNVNLLFLQSCVFLVKKAMCMQQQTNTYIFSTSLSSGNGDAVSMED